MAPEVMLASALASVSTLDVDEAARTLTSTGKWAAELKLDGIRAVATVTGDSVRLTNRNGVDITHRYPDVVAKLAGSGLNGVFDGEIVVYANLKPSFPMALKRDAQDDPRSVRVLARTMPATFVAFDVLRISGMDVTGLSYDSRRAHLEKLDGRLSINPSSGDGQTLWDFVTENKLEGLVLKRRTSRYQAGIRSPDWIKVKVFHRISALVSGYDPGKGHRASTFGALHLSLVDPEGTLVPVGSVGSGFSNDDLKLISELLRRNDPPLIVDVQYLEVTPDGRLRHTSFKGIRRDVHLLDCSTGQLGDQLGT